MPKIELPQTVISMLSKEDQIVQLNSEVKCTIAPSKIHGVGVIAIRDIKRGEKLYIAPEQRRRFYTVPYGSLNKLFPEIKEIVLARWPSVINGSYFQHPNDDAWLLLFMNHADNPNYNLADDTALKDIKKGEEVTENYRLMINIEKVYSWL